MKTTIKFPEGLVESEYNSTLVSFFVSIIVAGITLIVSYNLIDFEADTIISTLVTCGIFATIIAATILSFSLKQAVLASSGSPLICKTINFKESEYDKIGECAAKSRWSDIEQIAKNDAGIAMKMEIVYTKDKNFAAYQFFRYIPHNYESCSEVIYLNKEALSSLNLK